MTSATGCSCDSTYFLFGGLGERKKCLSKVCVVRGRVGGRRPSPASSGPGKKKRLLRLAPLRDVGMGGGEGLTGATQRWGRD